MRYIYSPLTPIADRWETSHRAGWALYWAQELGARVLTTRDMPTVTDVVRNTDEVYVYHGMEFKDAMNFPGGPPDSLYQRAKALRILAERLGPGLVSLDREMPAYGELLAKILDPKQVDTSRLTKALAKAGCLAPPREWEHKIVGDSHGLSMYELPNTTIHRYDALTLHGALQRGLEELCGNLVKVRTLTFYFGNIDIRHHLLRYPATALDTLLDEYFKQLKRIAKVDPKVELYVVQPLPIEHESRVLPKTGWFKGTPFFGTWQQRTELRGFFADRLAMRVRKAGFQLVKHPKHFTNAAGELSFDVMEKPRSVHIRPTEYRLIQAGGVWHGGLAP